MNSRSAMPISASRSTSDLVPTAPRPLGPVMMPVATSATMDGTPTRPATTSSVMATP